MYTKHVITTHDGAKIAVRYYNHKKTTKIPLVLNDGIGCAGFAWKYFINEFKRDHPIIHWNYRGHGSSTMGNQINSLDIYRLACDLSTVVTKLKVQNMILCGHSMGVQVALEAHCHLQDKIAGLVLLCGGPGNPADYWHASFTRHGPSSLANIAMKRLVLNLASNLKKHSRLLGPAWSYIMQSRLSYEFARAFEVDRNRTNWHDFYPYFADLGAIPPAIFGQLLSSVAKHSARDVLPEIRVPTLLVAADKDTFTPPWVVEDMHTAIPGSEYFVIKEGTHTATIEHPELLNLRVEKFLSSHNFAS